MKITLAKALKVKNKMVANLRKLSERIMENNSFNEINPPTYDSRHALEEYDKALNKLIALKVAVNTENVKIADTLLRIGEIKTKITFLRSTSTRQGVINGGHRGEQVTYTYIATIPEVELDQLIEKLEAEVDILQDKIDHFNATTEIEF